MPTFKYRAKNGPDNVEGTIEAQNREEAIEKVHALGYLPMRIEEVVLKSAALAAARKPIGGRIRLKDITTFYRQMASLFKSGVPILRAISIISKQTTNAAFQTMLMKIYAEVKDGRPLSQTLTNYPRYFSPLDVAMVHSGEKGGALPEVLFKIADYRLKQEEVFSRVRNALIYPLLMAVVGAGTIIFMLAFVMPRLMGIFSRTGQELPAATKILLAISSALQNWWWVILVVVIGVVVAVRQGSKNPSQKKALSRMKLNMPVLKDFVLKSELSRFCRTMELLLKSGIPMLSAIEVAIPTLNNDVIKDALSASYQALREGGSFGKSLESTKVFPAFMANLLVVGEESGRLDEALGEIALSYERDTDDAVKVLTSLLEPLMILVMGLVVGFIVIAMLLPVFQINTMVQ
jgi:type II secretory pathway component PulF